ncbi:MAG: HD domain-containing phosphohydrolase [Clostridiaceae bacterium]|nr:diguanylate cyclase [Eubacteriales bacterium]
MVSAFLLSRMFATTSARGFFAALGPFLRAQARDANVAEIAIIATLLVVLLFLAYVARNLGMSKKELERFNELRKAFFDAEDTVTYLKDENMRFAFANAAFEKFCGMSEREIAGKTASEVLPAAFSDAVLQIEYEALEDMRIQSGDMNWEKRTYKITAFPVSMVNGKVGVGVYLRDVTLEHSHAKLQQRILKRNEILVDVLNGSFKTREEQLDYMLLQALELTESKYGLVVFYDERRGEFTQSVLSGSVGGDFGEKLTGPVVPDFLIDIFAEAVKTRKPVIQNDYQAYLKEKGKGSPFAPAPVRYLCVPVSIDGGIPAVVGLADRESPYFGNSAYEATLLMNTTWNALERRTAQENLTLERNKYLQTILSIGDGVMVVDREGRVEMLNTVAEKLTGWTIDEAKGRPYGEVFHLTDEAYPAALDPVERALASNAVETLENDAVLSSRHGERYFLEDSAAPIRDEAGDTVGVVLVFRDATDKRAQRGRIEYLSMHDSLTGLYNRRYFEEQIRRFDTPENLPLSVIMGDVNDLKLINDIFGHSGGDLSIVHSAHAIQNVCRPVDIAARWGGDEFVLLLPQTTPAQAEFVVKRIHDEMASRRVAAIQCSLSLGYDVKMHAGEDIWRVLNSAEQSMYAEKTTGRSRLQATTLDAIIRALYKNSPREQEHAERTSAYCVLIGRAMGLPEDDIRKLKDAGLMHDIGKIVLDPELVRKVSVYTETDASEVKKHASAGYRILNSFDSTLSLAEAVLAHHERYDGYGYPKGLKASQIPLPARIISVAESYERITRDSAGIPARSVAEAIDILSENAGAQFDPYVVDVFIRALRETEPAGQMP